MAEESGSVISGIIWMTVMSLLLFWLPLGPLLAGAVGGKKAGGIGSALLAVLLPGLILAVALFFATSLLAGLPLVGVVFAALGGLYYLAGVGQLLVGAIIGGLLA